MEKSQIILSDCDGCLANWNDSFDRFMKSNNIGRVPNTDSKYSIADRYGISWDNAISYVKKFNDSEHIANLDPLLDSVEYVKKLSEHGFRFTVISSLGNSENSKKYRRQNLTQLFGNVFDEIHCISIHESKRNLLEGWKNSKYFWIEDHHDNATIGLELGLKSVLIKHPYNSEHNTFDGHVVNLPTPWKQIYNEVCKEYNLPT